MKMLISAIAITKLLTISPPDRPEIAAMIAITIHVTLLL